MKEGGRDGSTFTLYLLFQIADFGVSENWSSEETDASLHSSAGTPAFTAPETLDGMLAMCIVCVRECVCECGLH